MNQERLYPENKNPEPSMWVDEAIWGHRLYDEQVPWFIYLEFLNVAAFYSKEGKLFEEPNGYNRLVYKAAHRLYLRNILFNFPLSKMQQISHMDLSDNQMWDKWFLEMDETQMGLIYPDFSYLRMHFDRFVDLVDVIKLVHSSCLELHSNKRWTSKFVFPYCVDALYEDLDRKTSSNDRRFFGRTGELVYLMLCRAKGKEKLRKLLNERVFSSKDTMWETVIRSLQPANSSDGSERKVGFLPYESHHCFDSLCQDWIEILELNIPLIDLAPHLVKLVGFHVLRFQQELARESLNDENKSYYVAEIIAPKKTLVRELSVEFYQKNNNLSMKAVVDHIEQIEKSEKWQQACDSSDPFQNCKELLLERVLWPRKQSDYEGAFNPEDLMASLKAAVRRRHSQHVGNIHRVYGREIGLISKRGTNRLRYAPTDAFIRTLVLTNVNTRMEFKEFLIKLFERYNIVIGDVEAQRMTCIKVQDLDNKAFQNNAERLEQRLSSIGLLRRLSDGCAYLLNPYAK